MCPFSKHLVHSHLIINETQLVTATDLLQPSSRVVLLNFTGQTLPSRLNTVPSCPSAILSCPRATPSSSNAVSESPACETQHVVNTLLCFHFCR